MVIYVHGGTGNAYSLIDEPEAFAAQGIAGFTIECCGGTKMNPQSGGLKIFPSDYTSRIIDVETAIEYVKTLDHVDTDQIYLYGQSYGGLVVMMDAPCHNDDIKGVILESTGMDESGAMLDGAGRKGRLEEYAAPADWQGYMKEYTGDVIIFCSQGDNAAHANGQYTSTIYSERTQGEVKFYSFAGGDHSWVAFTDAAKQTSLEAMAKFIKEGEYLPWGNVFEDEPENGDVPSGE